MPNPTAYEIFARKGTDEVVIKLLIKWLEELADVDKHLTLECEVADDA